jgi:hypothetical protein
MERKNVRHVPRSAPYALSTFIYEGLQFILKLDRPHTIDEDASWQVL